jgi:hypothetical protein
MIKKSIILCGLKKISVDPDISGNSLFLSKLLIILIIGFISICGVVSADSYVGGIELSDVKTGTVSGGIWFDSYHAMETSAEKEFTLPENTDIKWARLYAVVYCGNMQDNRRGNLTVEFDGDGDDSYELLGIQEFNVSYSYPGEGGTGPVAVNDHCNRVTSDYLVWYDVKDLISSESVGVKAQTNKVDSTFDGRIKAVVLVMVYDDGDGEEIMYWIKQGHDVVSHYDESYTGSAVFDLSSAEEDFESANLSAIYLASADGTYSLNSEALTSGTPVGTYFGYDIWNVGETINAGVSNTFEYDRSGTFYKIILSAISLNYPESDVNLEVLSFKSNANEIFASEPNTITAEIKNNGTDASGPFEVAFDIAGSVTTVESEGLGAGNSTTVEILDESIFSDGQTVNITVFADSGKVISETDETDNYLEITETAVYNGYKGKRYTGGGDLNTSVYFEGYVDALYSSGNTAYNGAYWTEKTYSWSTDDLMVPDNAEIAGAYYYQGYSWNSMESDPSFTLEFNSVKYDPESEYMDRKYFGYYDIPSGMYVYNVTDSFVKSGNSVTLTPESENNYAIWGGFLVVVYRQENSGPYQKIWINEEFDNLYSYAKYAASSEEATAYSNFEDVYSGNVDGATAIALLANADETDKSKFFFNGDEYAGFWSDYDSTSQIGFSAYDVKDALKDGANTAAMQSYDPVKGDNMYAMASILKIEYSSAPSVDLEIVSLSSNANEIFANEPNTVTAVVKNNGTTASEAFSVLFTVNGNMTTVPVSGLGAGNSTTISIIDPEIRSFGETVNITAFADSGSSVTETDETNNKMDISETVVYNGYKGKSYTGGSDLDTVSSFKGHYDLLYSTGDTAYSGSFWSEMQFNWTYDDLPVPEGATVTEARLYQPYTYNKKGSDPSYTLTFNGETVSPVAKYSDQKSFGSYDYPYGLYVFDVTDEFDATGNSMAITNDTDNNYGIYGASLVVVYESASEPVRSIIINEEFDMIYAYSNYAVTSEEATAFAEYAHVESSSVSSAISVALLASAGDVNKSRFFFNDMEYEGFWPEYESKPQVGFSAYNVKDALKDGANTAAMQSYDLVKGDNMCAMASILKIEYIDSSGPSFVVPDMSTYNNGSITIPVFVRNITGAAGVAATITWDSSIVSVTDIVVNESVIINSSLYANLTSGYAEFAVTNTAGITATSDVSVIDLIVKAAADKAGKTCVFEGKNASWSDKSFIYHNMGFMDGTFTVTQRGDFNKNGYVDIGDVSNVAYMVAGKTTEILPEADFNDNGYVDTGDAAKIAWYFIGRINQL